MMDPLQTLVVSFLVLNGLLGSTYFNTAKVRLGLRGNGGSCFALLGCSDHFDIHKNLRRRTKRMGGQTVGLRSEVFDYSQVVERTTLRRYSVIY